QLSRTLRALVMSAREERGLYRAPAGFLTNMTNVTADGKYVCTGLYEDLSGKFKLDLLHGYVGFREYWAAMPLSQIVRIDTQSGGIPTKGGAAEVVFEEHYWIG